MGLAAAPTFVLSLVPLMLIGAAHLTSASTLNTTVQLQVDEHRRAQVLSLYFMVLMSSNPLGQLALGQLIELIGPRSAFGAYGAVLLGGTAMFHVLGWLRHMDVQVGEYSPEVVPEVHPTTPSPPRPTRPRPVSLNPPTGLWDRRFGSGWPPGWCVWAGRWVSGRV